MHVQLHLNICMSAANFTFAECKNAELKSTPILGSDKCVCVCVYIQYYSKMLYSDIFCQLPCNAGVILFDQLTLMSAGETVSYNY